MLALSSVARKFMTLPSNDGSARSSGVSANGAATLTAGGSPLSVIVPTAQSSTSSLLWQGFPTGCSLALASTGRVNRSVNVSSFGS